MAVLYSDRIKIALSPASRIGTGKKFGCNVTMRVRPQDDKLVNIKALSLQWLYSLTGAKTAADAATVCRIIAETFEAKTMRTCEVYRLAREDDQQR
jgi:hypothetical protein